MNKQSNSYTIIYSIILVIVVGVSLSLVYQILKPIQDENIANDKKRQILAAVLISPKENENVAELYDKYIIDSYITNHKGDKVNNDISPFDINVANEIKKPETERNLPVFVCKTENNETKYIIPVYGAGLWGPIWGYVAFNSTGKSIYGAYFAHQSETPGLGAEIESSDFQRQFIGKEIYDDNQFQPIKVVKIGQEPSDKPYVHAISGGTTTSQGVEKMLENSLLPYDNFLKNLKTEK